VFSAGKGRRGETRPQPESIERTQGFQIGGSRRPLLGKERRRSWKQPPAAGREPVPVTKVRDFTWKRRGKVISTAGARWVGAGVGKDKRKLSSLTAGDKVIELAKKGR